MNELRLPNNYRLVYDGIEPEEINELRKKINWNADEPERWRDCLATSIVVGVRHNAELVGIGFIAGNARHGVLCDLSTDPQHHDQKIAEAIIDESLRLAKQKGMRYFYLHMSTPSPLRQYYLDVGFQNTGGSLFRNDTLA